MGSQETPSKSRFAHFYPNTSRDVNNGQPIQGNGTLGNDDMRVSAGIVYRSPPNGHAPEVTGSFVSATMTEKGRPASVETTIVQPDHNGGTKISSVSPQARGGDSIGQVTFNAPQNGVSNGVHTMMEHSGQRFHFQQQHQHPYPLPDPCELFKITVNNLFASKKYDFEVKAKNTVGHLQELLFRRINIPAEQQILIFGCKKLHSNETLGDCGIKAGSVISLEVRLRGG